MGLSPQELARRDGGAVEFRAEPLRVEWVFSDLTSRDAHSIDARYSASVRLADAPADRKIFAEILLASRPSVSKDMIAAHFHAALQTALRQSVAEMVAVELVGGMSRQTLLDALRQAGDAVAFACGLELLAPFQLTLESPTLQRQKLEQVARQQAEHRTAGQLQQLAHATELLKQFQQMRQAAPDLPAGQLLQRIDGADRGMTLQTLLLAASTESARAPLWAVAGASLLRIDARATPPKTQLIPLTDSLGPLRSVQPGLVDGRKVLLVGARSGVIILTPENPSSTQTYAMPQLDSQLGFNRVVVAGDMIWASHSDAGIVGWKLGAGDTPAAVYAERSAPATPASNDDGVSIVVSGSSSRIVSPTGSRAGGAKHLQALDDRHLLYSVGNDLIIRAGDERTSLGSQSRADIVAILPTPRAMVAVHADGTLVIVDRNDRMIVDIRNRGTSISTAGVMPWLGDVRLLLAGEAGPVDCLGLDDPLVSEYLSPYRGLKIVTASADLIAAVTPDRQRVVIWNAWDATRPAGEVHVTSLARHRVADLEFEG